MDPPDLQLWERAALRPQGPVSARRARSRREPPSASSAPDLRASRRLCARSHAATMSGLFLSLVLSVPLGWSFVQSSFLDRGPALAEECPDLSGLLAPDVQRGLEEKRASGGLSRTERHALNVKVCDPSVRALLRPLLEGVTDMAGLQSVADAHPVLGAGLEPMPMLMSLLGRSPKGD